MPEPIPAERAVRIRKLCAELSELPEGERAPFLGRICRVHTGLRRELGLLLDRAYPA